MLKTVRHAAKSGFSYILVAGLIVIFAFFFGVPANSCGSSPNAAFNMASVDGNNVNSQDINVIYNQLYSSNTTPDPEELERQRALSLKAYLMIELLAKKAHDAGFRVNDEEFTEYMTDPLRNPEFLSAYGRTGAWDAGYYERYVQNFLLVSLPSYESFKKNELLARKYINMIEMQVNILPQQIDQLEALRNTKINLEYVSFNPTSVEDAIQLSDAQVSAFLSSNAEDVKNYYDTHLGEYSEPEQMEVRRIYLEVGNEDADGNDAEARLAAAKKRVDAGEDFAVVAGSINDALKDAQGLMDMTATENMNQDIVNALDGAKVGDVREVTTDSALMLVKLEAKKDAVKTPLADVQRDIATDLLKDKKVNTMTDKLANELLAKAQTTGSLSSALAALSPADSGDTAEDQNTDDPADETAEAPTSIWSALSVQETGDFTLEGQDMSNMFGGQLPPGVSLGRSAWDKIPKIGQSRKLAVDAFSKLTTEKPLGDKVYTAGKNKVVVSLKSKATTPAEDAKKDTDDTAGSDDASEAASSTDRDKLVEELVGKKTQDLLGQWQRLFQRRTQFGASLTLDYGPWLEGQFKEAVDSGVIELKPKTGGLAVTMIDPNTVTVNPGGNSDANPLLQGSADNNTAE